MMKLKLFKQKLIKPLTLGLTPVAVAVMAALTAPSAHAVFLVTCPGDSNSDAIVDADQSPGSVYEKVMCYHLTASDGYINVPDEGSTNGRSLYIFSYNNLTGSTGDIVNEGQLKSRLPAPLITGKQGQDIYLTLSNPGLANRPDLPDAHTVHYHGFPEASAIYDGVPDVSISPNSMSSFTYYYHLEEPGSYIYHCHFEATEHMQMGMIGNLYVEPMQNELADGTDLNGYTHRTGQKYVYNDGDGSTAYDVEKPIQVIGMYADFHDANEFITALPFATMEDQYTMINGRAYPDTVRADADVINDSGFNAQNVSSKMEVTTGEKLLIRLSNVSIVNGYTLTAPGLTMKLVGRGARVYRGKGGQNLYQDTSQLTLEGGDVFDVIINTEGVDPGTYFLYTTNLNYLSNNQEDYGGIMTEIVVKPQV